MTMLWDSLGPGHEGLMFSADIQMARAKSRSRRHGAKPAEPASLSKPLAWTTVAMALIFGIGVFFVTPLAVVGIAEQFVGAHTVWSNLAEGLIRLALLVGYVALIGLMPDVKRVYAYHGAEHMTIHAWEHNDPLDPGMSRGTRRPTRAVGRRSCSKSWPSRSCCSRCSARPICGCACCRASC